MMQNLIRSLSSISAHLSAAQTVFDIAYRADGTITRNGKPIPQNEVEQMAFDSLAQACAMLAEQLEELRQIKTAQAFDRFEAMLQGGNV